MLFMNEAGFTRDGIISFCNSHVWADENAHAAFQSRHQHRFSINLWAGILGDRLISPYILLQRSAYCSYLNFIVSTLPELLEDVPLGRRVQLWFMRDGALPHFTITVREHLHNTYTERWVGHGETIAWPLHSCDLNLLDFFLWGHLKSVVYATAVNNVEDLQQ
jgi:hypothetical protein